MLARTPEPVEAGEIRASIVTSYSLYLTSLPPCEPSTCPPDGIGPAYLPISTPFNVFFANGLEGNAEWNFTIAMGYLPGLRVGYKQLLLQDSLKLALDFGGSLYFSNAGADLGLLMSFPSGDMEPYLAARGFFNYYWFNSPSSLTWAATVGNRFSLGHSDLFVELTLATGAFDGIGSLGNVNPVGWSIVPAIGFRF